MISCVVCTTQGIPICSVKNHDYDSGECVSRLVASISCLLTQSTAFTMCSNDKIYAIITKYYETVRYHVIFSTQSEHFNDLNELQVRAAIVSHTIFTLHGAVLTRILAFYDAKSSHDLANSTFANSVADSLCLDEEVLEEVFGDDATSKEALTNFEDHLIHDLVHVPLDESVSDPWFRPLETALRGMDSSVLHDAAAFLFLVGDDTNEEHEKDSNDECSLSLLISRNLLSACTTDQSLTHTPPSEPLNDSWLSLVRRRQTAGNSSEVGEEGWERSARLMCFVGDDAPSPALRLQCILVDKITANLVLVVRLPVSVVNTGQLINTVPSTSPPSSNDTRLHVCALHSPPLLLLPQNILEAWTLCCGAMRRTLSGGAATVQSLGSTSISESFIAPMLREEAVTSVITTTKSLSELQTVSATSTLQTSLVGATADEPLTLSHPLMRPVPPPTGIKSSASRSVVVGAAVESADTKKQTQQSTRPGRTLRPV